MMDAIWQRFKMDESWIKLYLTDLYNCTMSIKNPNVVNWPWMSSPLETICLTLTYVLLVNILPLVMKHFKELKLKYINLIYNLFLVGLNVYISGQIIYLKYTANDVALCTNIRSTGSPASLEMNKVIWLFYVTKGIEFLDTIFFILKKDFHKVSFLHIFNHASMFPIWWVGTLLFADGTLAVVALLDSLIHIIMHYYYTLSNLGPNFQKLTWWKKYFTILHMLRFCLVIVYFSVLLYQQCEDNSAPNEKMMWFIIFYSLTHVALIYDLYTSSYYSLMDKHLKNGNGYSRGRFSTMETQTSPVKKTNGYSSNASFIGNESRIISGRRPLYDPSLNDST